MSDDLALVDADVVDSNILARSLVTLLSLTSDAVIAFDAEGRIVLANTEAERLFRVRDKGLVETDVRDLFSCCCGGAVGGIRREPSLLGRWDHDANRM